MTTLRLLLLAAAMLIASPVRATGVWGVTVCNNGTLRFNVAFAEKQAEGAGRYSWRIEGWTLVAPRKCEEVFRDNWWGDPKPWARPAVHLAFVLTDASGRFGYADFAFHGQAGFCDQRGTCQRSRIQICGSKAGMNVAGLRDPTTVCDGKPGTFLVPAVFAIEPEFEDMVNSVTREAITTKISLALDRDYKALPFPREWGGGSSSSASASSAGNMQQLAAAVGEAINVFNALVSGKGDPSQYRWIDICVDPAIVRKESWADPPSRRTQALKEALTVFLLSHGQGELRLEITEPGKFVIEDMHKRECTGSEIHQRVRAF